MLCCCSRRAVGPAPVAPRPPPPPLTLDLVADLPPHTRESSAFTSYEDKSDTNISEEKKSVENVIIGSTTEVDIGADEVDDPPPPPRSPSIRVEDYSEKSNPSIHSSRSRAGSVSNEFGSQQSLNIEPIASPEPSLRSRKSTQNSTPSKSRSASPSPVKSSRSGNPTPEPTSDAYHEEPTVIAERDVRNALAECIVPAKQEDWEIIVNRLIETERLAVDPTARAPATSWRAVVRSASSHVRSLRSRVARAACSAVGALFEHRGRALDNEIEDAACALLDRCADVNRFLRADAASALVRIACGSNYVRTAVALSRRGATHRAGPVRAAAAQALSKLVQHNGASRVLDMPSDPRTVLLRAAGELLGDANAETRVHARQLCLALTEDTRFRQMLKDAMLPTRFLAIEKFVDKLRCR